MRGKCSTLSLDETAVAVEQFAKFAEATGYRAEPELGSSAVFGAAVRADHAPGR